MRSPECETIYRLSVQPTDGADVQTILNIHQNVLLSRYMEQNLKDQDGTHEYLNPLNNSIGVVHKRQAALQFRDPFSLTYTMRRLGDFQIGILTTTLERWDPVTGWVVQTESVQKQLREEYDRYYRDT